MGRLMLALMAWMVISVPTGLVTGRILRIRAKSGLIALDLDGGPRAGTATYDRIHEAWRSRVGFEVPVERRR